MTDRSRWRRSPVVLVVDDQEWSARSLETILVPNGFAVLRAFTAAKGLERARLHPPDIVFLSKSLPDSDGLSLCRALRDPQVLGDRVPLLFTFVDRPSRVERLTALRAGAWDVLTPPIDSEELVSRLEAYVRAKFDGDRLREASLIDSGTQFYNVNGLERRAIELGSWATRHGESLGCVILGLVSTGQADEGAMGRAVDSLVAVMRKTGRTSDVIGRMGQSEFAVLAPGTDANHAIMLAERLAAPLRAATVPSREGMEPPFKLRGGYDAVSDARETPIKGPELIAHAAAALGRAKAERNEEWLRPFRAPPSPH